MPIISSQKLIGLPVETESGQYLGKIIDFEIQINSQKITRYNIGPAKLIVNLFGQTLIIASSQVASIFKDKMVVFDGVVKEKESDKQVVAEPIT